MDAAVLCRETLYLIAFPEVVASFAFAHVHVRKANSH